MELLQAAMALLVSTLLLGMGATIEGAQMKNTFTAHRRAVIIGFISQFGLMPLIAFTMAVALDMPNAVGLSMVVIGCTPVRGSPAGTGDRRWDLTGFRRACAVRQGGSTSNYFTYLSGGDVALSVLMCGSRRRAGWRWRPRGVA